MRIILPIFFILAAAGLFFGYIDPAFSAIKELRAESAQFDEALDKSKELQAIRDELLSRFNTFPTEKLDRLQKLVPDAIDNVRLVLNLDDIASQYNMRVRDVSISSDVRQPENAPQEIGPDTKPFDSVILSFSVNATYAQFLRFIRDLEDSLRLIDVVSVSFSAPEGDLYQFDVSIRTYWLR